MAKQKKRPGRRPLGKMSLQLRVSESTHEELARLAALDQTTMSEYAEAVLERHFKARRAKGG